LKFRRFAAAFLSLIVPAVAADAATLQISATSAAAGDLGYFIVDDAVFATDTDLVASQFIDYSFTSPLSGVTLDPSTVDGDTGITSFGLVGGEWTVIGGGGDSLTDTDTGSYVWIASTWYIAFGGGHGYYRDVSWSTTELSAVPLPASLGLLAFAIGGVGLAAGRRRG